MVHGRIIPVLLTAVISILTLSCAQPTEPTPLMQLPAVDTEVEANPLTQRLQEVAPPQTLRTLQKILATDTPQVRILSPRPGEVLDADTVSVRLQIRGLTLYQDGELHLGPHIEVMLDNQPSQAVYDVRNPVIFSNLSPGTHTLRVFAAKPWFESFKNEGAFDIRTFHLYAKTPETGTDSRQPLLTYVQPQASYGAEPIMLDYYLTNAPLHMVAQEDSNDNIRDWRIRATVNGESFVFDQWQPIYLTGFEPGRNWLKLELIDDHGTAIANEFNSTVRVIDYQPGGRDTLSQLVRGELELKQVLGLVDPEYSPPVIAEEVEPVEPVEPDQPIDEGSIEAVEPVEPTNVEPVEPTNDDGSDGPEAVGEITVPSEHSAPEPGPSKSEAAPAEVAPSEIEPSETEPLETEPLETEPSETAPLAVETEPSETAPPEPTPLAVENDSEELASPLEETRSLEAAPPETSLPPRTQLPDEEEPLPASEAPPSMDTAPEEEASTAIAPSSTEESTEDPEAAPGEERPAASPPVLTTKPVSSAAAAPESGDLAAAAAPPTTAQDGDMADGDMPESEDQARVNAATDQAEAPASPPEATDPAAA